MSDISPDETRHIHSSEQFMTALIDRIADTNNKTNYRLEMITSCLNIMKEFMIGEAEYARVVQRDIKKLIRIDLLKEKS